MLKSYCAIVGLVLMSSHCHALSVSDINDPPGASVTYVGEMVQNGLPMQIKQFTTDATIGEVLAYYKQRWADVAKHQENVPDYIEKQAGEWRILTKMEASNSVVVQLRKSDQGDTEGFISVTDLSRVEEPNKWSSDFPRMLGSQLVSNTESYDKGRRAYTLVIINDHSVEENIDYYRSSMDSEGWHYSRGGSKDNTLMLHFTREGWLCDMTMTAADDGKTVIFANLVEMNGNG